MSNKDGSIQLIPKKGNIVEDNEDLPKENAPEKAEEKAIILFHEHFRCSEHDHNNKDQETPLGMWEADTYHYGFNLKMFFKSLIVFLFEVSGLGLLLFFFRIIFGSNFLNNLHWIGFESKFIRAIGWINNWFVTYSIYHRNFIFTDAKSLLYIAEIVFYAIIGASLNSYINNKIPPLLSSVQFSKESLKNTDPDRSTDAVKDRMKKEFKRTILRLNIDASSFFMTFLEEISGEEKFKRELIPEKLINKDPITENTIPDGQFKKIREEGDKLISNIEISEMANLVAEAVEFEDDIFNYKFLTKPTRYDKTKAYGYSYAEKIIEEFRPNISKYYDYLFLAAFFGIIAMSFMGLGGSDESSEGLVKRFFERVGGLLLNFGMTCFVLLVVLDGADVLWTRLDFMKGLTELISEEKPAESSLFRKNCSMINIFDAESLMV